MTQSSEPGFGIERRLIGGVPGRASQRNGCAEPTEKQASDRLLNPGARLRR